MAGGGAMRSRITRTGRVLEDTFFKQAKAKGYVARSAFKLQEIQQKHKLISPGGAVLDLGCHPGAWLQVACESLGPTKRGGRVIGVDIQETRRPDKFCDDRVEIVQADARELGPEFWALHCPGGVDVVLSDMCHFTLGNSVADAFKSLDLARTAWGIATGGDNAASAEEQLELPWGAPGRGVLKPGGSLVMKILQGTGTQEFAAELRRDFTKVAWHRCKATRSESKEIFLLGLKRK
ncbi:ribosomal RNA methyltransferase mitochondrial isoform X1 [Micractinium conductrix]|uniref:rRNA methyltransferase 2, mitochondrial n=1 Tax=Micractinium conductrix TaxID=554055 RepID=A0A2P6VJK0_9CHLO|nr:ribosomal RNA methyltransferase mitochondrial isoform X1 [Micractinium conductrix]|eukprot:PSC74281.1 ribosomal RNA methyltransferase mitochondrial isoform X1 [Micractinium conductrix]